ncbi:hypothetical protein HUJ04_009061 [Dendroctonus ponderosae]|nr:hypothetical protein HUJ04_009061 [Dendroctonus ponderosae]
MDFTRKPSTRPSLKNAEAKTSPRELKYDNKSSGKRWDHGFSTRTSSSGFGSSESYHIEGSSSKRNLPTSTPSGAQEKKIKLDKEPLDVGPSAQPDNLDDLELSAILQQTVAKRRSSGLTKSEFDAFAFFLNKGSNNPENNMADTGEDIFSQSFNTQVINQINVAIDDEESRSLIESDDDNINTRRKAANPSKNIFKHPIAKPLPLQAKPLKENSGDRSMLFTSKAATSKFMKEVDDLFEQVEQSICLMGTSDELRENLIPDELLDILFAEDQLNANPNINEKIEEFNKPVNEESFLAEANCSLGTVIKQALLNNATKINQPKSEISNLDLSLNRSGVDAPAKFKQLGDFYGLPDHVKDLVKQYKGIDKLYDWQEECLNMAIESRSNLIYALPTSGGKTLVAEVLMLREILCYQKNVIFILPYVAIVQEKVWDFSPFGVALDFLVEEYASNKGVYPPRKRRRKNSVYIATIEKGLGLLNSLIETGRLSEIGLIVIDELHLIGEEGRGATLEACLSKIIFLAENIQIVGMSATIGNIEDISKFLNAEVYRKNFRPVELTEYVKCENQIAKINWGCKDENDLLIDVKKLDFKYSEAVSKLDPDMLGGLVLQVVPKGSCLVFCPSRTNCENVVHLLCKLTKPHLKDYKKNEKNELLKALEEDCGELCRVLRTSVPFGIAYHHSGKLLSAHTFHFGCAHQGVFCCSGLTSEERRLIEEAFRAGTISVICCTSTLAAGVNLPARRVILRSPYTGKEFINLSKYKQMAGRAGRAGLGETGESIIVTSSADLPKVKKLLMSPMTQAMSDLPSSEGKGLSQLLLSCISLGIANTRFQLQKVSRSTLMAVQEDRLDVNIKALTDSVIKKLFKLGALQEGDDQEKSRSVASQCNVSVKMDTSVMDLESISQASSSNKSKRTLVLTSNAKLVVSNLGRAAIKAGLQLTRAHQLYDDLHQAQKSLVLLNCLHLLYLVTPYETANQIRPNIHVYYDVLTHLHEREMQTARILGFDEACITKMATGQTAKVRNLKPDDNVESIHPLTAFQQVPEKVLNRFYVTLMLNDLWNEMPVFQVSDKYQINRGIVQNLMTVSATFATNVVNFCVEMEEFWAFSHLLKGLSQRLSHCCNRELVPLMELPAVKQSRAKQLYNAGYKNLQSIAKAKVHDLIENIEFMSRRTAGQLIAASKMLLLEKVENLREEAEDVLDGVENPRDVLHRTPK